MASFTDAPTTEELEVARDVISDLRRGRAFPPSTLQLVRIIRVLRDQNWMAQPNERTGS